MAVRSRRGTLCGEATGGSASVAALKSGALRVRGGCSLRHDKPPEIPGHVALHELVALKRIDIDAVERHHLVRRLDSQKFAGVPTGRSPTGDDLVSLRDLVVDLMAQIGECRVHLLVEPPRLLQAEWLLSGEVELIVRREQLIQDPDVPGVKLIEPPPDDCFCVVDTQ